MKLLDQRLKVSFPSSGVLGALIGSGLIRPDPEPVPCVPPEPSGARLLLPGLGVRPAGRLPLGAVRVQLGPERYLRGRHAGRVLVRHQQVRVPGGGRTGPGPDPAVTPRVVLQAGRQQSGAGRSSEGELGSAVLLLPGGGADRLPEPQHRFCFRGGFWPLWTGTPAWF